MNDLSRLSHRLCDADKKLSEALFRIQALEGAIMRAEARNLPTLHARKTLKTIYAAYETMKLFRKSLDIIYAVQRLSRNDCD